MAGLVGQNQQGAFVAPTNGTTATATVVLANDNNVRTKHNAHDADPTIHVQSGLVGDRPAAGTPQRLYYATDERRLQADTGSTWVDVAAGQVRQDSGATGPLANGANEIIFELQDSASLGTYVVHAVSFAATPHPKYMIATIAGSFADGNFYVLSQTGDIAISIVNGASSAGFYLTNNTGSLTTIGWSRYQVHGAQP